MLTARTSHRSRLLVAGAGIGVLLSLTGAALSPVSADRAARRDGNDLRHRLDIRRVVHSHGGDEDRVRHKLVSYETWGARALRKNGWRISFSFTIDKNVRDVERRIVIRRRGGVLRATFFAGRHGTKRTDEEVRLWRPNGRSVAVAFDADLLRDGIRAYRWWGGVYEGGSGATICQAPCQDSAPNDRPIRHVLE